MFVKNGVLGRSIGMLLIWVAVLVVVPHVPDFVIFFQALTKLAWLVLRPRRSTGHACLSCLAAFSTAFHDHLSSTVSPLLVHTYDLPIFDVYFGSQIQNQKTV